MLSGISQLAIALTNDAVGKIVDQGTASTFGSPAERAVEDTIAEVFVTVIHFIFFVLHVSSYCLNYLLIILHNKNVNLGSGNVYRK